MPASPHLAIVVFTKKSVDHILSVGGSDWWVLNDERAEKYPYIVCCRSGLDLTDGDPPQGSAFLVGRISGVISGKDGKRKRIQISEYATVAIPGAWKGWRNPVRYSDLAELGINPKGLKFLPVPEVVGGGFEADDAPEEEGAHNGGLTIQQAKRGLAKTFAVAEDAIEIVIRG